MHPVDAALLLAVFGVVTAALAVATAMAAAACDIYQERGKHVRR